MDQQQQQRQSALQQQQVSQSQQQVSLSQQQQQQLQQQQQPSQQQQLVPLSQQQVSQQQAADDQVGAGGGSQAQQPVTLQPTQVAHHSQTPHVVRGPVSVRRPRAVLFDILGTASKSGFLEKILFPYLQANLEPFIAQHWRQRNFVRLYAQIVQQSSEFNRQNANVPIVMAHESNGARQSLLNFITYITDNGINSSAVTRLRFMVWFTGYQLNKLTTPIYSDVADRMRHWFAEGIKFYVFSNAWVDAQKELLRNTNHGDLTNLISGFYDNDFGLLTDSDSYKRLCTDIKIAPNDVVFLTKSPVEGRAAMEAGLSVVLVLTHRHNVKAVSHEDRQLFPYVRTLRDLTWLEGSMNPATSELAVSQRPTRMQRSSLSRAPTSPLPDAGNTQVPTAISAPSATHLVSAQPTSGASRTTPSQVTTGTQSAAAMAALGSTTANKSRRPTSSTSAQVSAAGAGAASSNRAPQHSSTRTRTGGVSGQAAATASTASSKAKAAARTKQSSAASSTSAKADSRKNSTS